MNIIAAPKLRYKIKDGKIIDTTVAQTSPVKPSVYFSNRALRAIEHIVNRCNEEVAWLGLVDAIDPNELADNTPAYLISEIFIPKQTVTGTTVDIDKNDMARLINWMMDNNHDPGKLRYHGHSHVNMHTHPSGTDNEYIEEQLEHVPFFVRSIHNKKSEQRVDVFDRDLGIVHENVHTDNWDTLETPEFYASIGTILDAHVTKKTFQTRPQPPFRDGPSTAQNNRAISWADRQQQELDEIWQYHLDHPEKSIKEYLAKVKNMPTR